MGRVKHPAGADEMYVLFVKLEWREQRTMSVGRWEVKFKTE